MVTQRSWLSRNWKLLLVIILAPVLSIAAYAGNIYYQINRAPAWDKQVIVEGDLVLFGEDLGMHGVYDVANDRMDAHQYLGSIFAEANQKAVALREQGVVTTPASGTGNFYNVFIRSNTRQSWPAFAGLGDEAHLGMSAPDFDLQTTEGERYRLSDHNGKIRVFMMAAVTCGSAFYQVTKWNELIKKYNSTDVEFVVIYSIERHSGEQKFTEFSWPSNFDEKMAYARILRDYTDTNITIAVDDFDAKVLNTYGNVPNSAFVVDQKGRIVFRASWADSRKIEYVLDEMLSRKAEQELAAVKVSDQ